MKYKEVIKEGILEGNYDSFELMFATEFEEFYYEDTDKAVPEGHPIGFDVDTVTDSNVGEAAGAVYDIPVTVTSSAIFPAASIPLKPIV